MSLAYIGIGSNLGDCAVAVAAAIVRLGQIGEVRARSLLYCTRPWGRTNQPDFINAVVLLDTPLSARMLLRALQDLETVLGRTPGERWGPRRIDLDILTYAQERIDEPDLQIPHPRLCERAFVLVPLAEIDSTYAPYRDRLAADELARVQAHGQAG